MRHLLLPLLFLLSAGCAAGAPEDVLPISASIKAASHVSRVDLVILPSAAPAIAAADTKALGRSGERESYRSLPLEQGMERMVKEVTRSHGLASGRALTLIVEIDHFQVADEAAAIFGKDDRLSGSVFVRDAGTGEALGQLYLNVSNVNGGFLSLIARGGSVREGLIEEFARRIARHLGGREPA